MDIYVHQLIKSLIAQSAFTDRLRTQIYLNYSLKAGGIRDSILTVHRKGCTERIFNGCLVRPTSAIVPTVVAQENVANELIPAPQSMRSVLAESHRDCVCT